MEKENLNKENPIIGESKISQNNDLAGEELKVLSADNPERFLSYFIPRTRWDSKRPDWNTRGEVYGRRVWLITQQVQSCKKLIGSVDQVFHRYPHIKLNKAIVEVFCKVGEHNPIVAFIAEAYKNTFSKEGKEYYEEWCKKHQNVIPKSKAFKKWMTTALIEQRVTDGTPGIIDFNHIDKNIESKIYTEIQRHPGFGY